MTETFWGPSKNLLGTFRYLWVPLGTSGYLWVPLSTSENLWEPLGTSGNLWEPLGTTGNLWEPLETSRNLWAPLGTSGYLPGTFREPSGNLPGNFRNLWVPLGKMMMSFICSCRIKKIGAKLHIYLQEGTYHKRLFRGPSTNDMKK